MNFAIDKVFETWERIINIGVDENKWGNKRKKIRLTNIMAIVLVIISFPIGIYFYYLGYHIAGIGIFLVDFSFLGSIYLNKIKYYNLAKFLILALVNFAAFPYELLFGFNSGIQYIYLPFSCLPLVLFELREWKAILLSACVSVFFFLEPTVKVINIPITSVNLEVQSQIYFPIMLVVFSVILSSMYYISCESELAEDLIIQAKKDNEIQIHQAREVVDKEFSSEKNSIAEILNLQLINLKKSEYELISSNDYLRRINNDLDNFVYTASHDLKSPISNIEGLINILTSNKNYENEEIKEIIDLMSLSVAKFKNTVNELIEVSKIEQAETEENEEVYFADLLEDVKFSINELIKVSHAQVIDNFSLVSSIKFSKRNLRSIIYNLLSNAIKYKAMDRDPKVIISTRFTDNGLIVLSIEDNGLGIAEDNIPKIFSMFKRVHNHVEGSGVGLYIVKKIMENNNGKITVESKVGVGSKFNLIFNTVL